tara:strand:+ start:205 stop:480 length:276 start_codon:yes stop_codon:yes gene_type:complete
MPDISMCKGDGCPKFFYMGKTFDNEKDFLEYVYIYGKTQVDLESFNAHIDMFKNNLWLNLKLRDVKITNGELANILSDYFLLIIERCFKNA